MLGLRGIARLSVFWVLVGLASQAAATEGGGSSYPLGVANFSCCALPPPGVYGMVYYQRYEADVVRGDHGQVTSPPTYRLVANALVPRLVWVTPWQVLGGAVSAHAVVPLVRLEMEVVAGVRETQTGSTDPVTGLAIGWHLSPELHVAVGADVFVPIGTYDKQALANLGRNYWALQPYAGLTYLQGQGLNVDLKAMYQYNFENGESDYLSGQELILDYALGWGVGRGWALGLGGYLYSQVTDDETRGQVLPQRRGRSIAVGPAVRYQSPQGWLITAKYQDEMFVRNRSDGSGVWIQAALKL